MQRLSRLAFPLFTRTKSSEVFCRNGNLVREELHNDAPCFISPHLNVKKDARVFLATNLANIHLLHFSGFSTVQACKSSEE
jgi:hypothetical protein